MSFSSQVKEEIAKHIGGVRHCQLAELAALIAFNGEVIRDSIGDYSIKIVSENPVVIKKCFVLLKKTFGIEAENFIDANTDRIVINDSYEAKRILEGIKMLDEKGLKVDNHLVSPQILRQQCCRRCFIRGAFLAAGSVSDPNASYHFEIVCSSEDKAKELVEIIESFEVEAKIVFRKKYYVVYVKEGSFIVDLLNIMEAHVALMELENVRIVKEVRNTLNRQINCETANMNKSAVAGVRQISDIEYIRDTVGLDILKEGLRDIAYLRLENSSMNLKDLGQLLDPPVGKSGVNHRLKKISEIAQELRGNRKG